MKQLAYYQSPVGDLKLVVNNNEIVSLDFDRNKPREKETNSPFIKKCFKELDLYFNNKLKKFSLPLNIEGSPFFISVWNELLKIPLGQILTYGKIAKRIGKPKAARAVGMACNRNKIAIIIPCHRVIGTNGNLVGYGGGLEMKRKLLVHEGVTCL